MVYIFIISVVGINYAAYCIDRGYSIAEAAGYYSLMLGVISISKPLLGRLYDSLPLSRLILITTGLMLVGLVCLLWIDYSLCLYLSIIIAGLGSANYSLSLQGISSKLFGPADYPTIVRVFMVGANTIYIIAPSISGLVYDMTGDYDPMFKFMLIIGIILLVVYYKATSKIEETFPMGGELSG